MSTSKDTPDDDGHEDNYSDISLDEEDEELIWRVFFGGEKDAGDDDVLDDYSLGEDSIDVDDIDLDDIDDQELVDKYKQLRQMKIDKNMSDEDKKRLLTTNLSNDQMNRFEAYRGMKVNRPGVKKICNGVLGHSVPNNIAIILSGISKLLLGEIISRAMEIQERDAKGKLIIDADNKKLQKYTIMKSLETGREVEVDDQKLQYDGDYVTPLQPYHIREAWRLYKLENSSSFTPQWRRQGEADGKMFR